MARDQYRRVTIDKFEQGVIHSGNYPASLKPTLAQPGYLYLARGCVASPSGALAPGWDIVEEVIEDVPNDNWSTTHRPSGGKQILVDALEYGDTTYADTLDNPFPPFRLYEEFYDATGTSGPYDTHAIFYAPTSNSPYDQTISYSDTAAEYYLWKGGLPGGVLCAGRSWIYTNTPPGGFAAGSTGSPFPVVVANLPRAWVIANRMVFPDLDVAGTAVFGTVTLDEYIEWSEDEDPGIAATFHQERFVWSAHGWQAIDTLSPGGFDGNLLWTPEIHYTPRLQGGYRDVLLSGLYESETLEMGETAEVHAWYLSINANTMMVMTRSNGAYLIRGDLDYAQITKLAGVPPCLTPYSMPVATVGGAFYTTRTGAYLLSENGDAQLLSPQLALNSFDPGPLASPTGEHMSDHLSPMAPQGRCAYYHPYLLAPNGWMMDTRSGSWWQLPLYSSTGDKPQYSHYSHTADGYVKAYPWYRDETYRTAYVTLDPSTPLSGEGQIWTAATHFIPDVMPPQRNNNIREVEVVLSGTGTVTIFIFNNNGTYAVAYEVNDSYPIRLRDQTRVPTATPPSGGQSPGQMGSWALIQATGTSDNPLPTVHEITLLINDTQSIATS